MINNIPRIMIASVMSGGGKTTVTAALLRALNNRGLRTAAYKCGPDYIDPMYHRAASGRDSINLDMYFYGRDKLRELFAESSQSADIAVAEGVMGFYDGMSMESEKASTYETASALGMPVILVLNARGMAHTVIPIINAVSKYREDSGIKAVILNDVTEMTYKMLKPVIERETGVAAVGYIPRLTENIKSRHLGLVLPFENAETENIIAHISETIEKTVDIDSVLGIAADTKPIGYSHRNTEKKDGVKIAVAYDNAFCFYYRDNMDILERLGAEIVFFSPQKDSSLPEGACGLLLGGGYPELHAAELSANADMLRDIKNKLSSGMPTLAECGGFMYLHESMEGADGNDHRMAGVIAARAFRTDRLVRFGYAELTANSGSPYMQTGEKIKGHEFHYWDSTDNGNSCTAAKPSGKRSWSCMYAKDNIFAGFPHLCYASNTAFAERFVDKCREYKE